MARVKPKRHGVLMDMTAMTDVAFLLLTFFILTTQFKKPDVESIKPPSSISQILLDDKDLMTINITSAGKFYFTPVQNVGERKQLIDKMAQKYNTSFSEQEKIAFVNNQAVGVPMSQLKSFLDLPDEERKNFKGGSGVPMDSVNKQLIDWVKMSLEINPNYKLAIKGDEVTKYPRVKDLFEGLRDIKYYKFWLITNQEANK
jgi:biopolymer transport protein ExbD